MNAAIQEKLDAEDDPELWQVVIDNILPDLESHRGIKVEIGRCSHWLAPNKYRWTYDGGNFAAPVGYGGGRYSLRGLPLFDWSIVIEWTGEDWVVARNTLADRLLRVAIPSRTKRHHQAAIHTKWMQGSDDKTRLYGFEKSKDGWRLAVVSRTRDERKRDKSALRCAEMKKRNRKKHDSGTKQKWPIKRTP